MSRLQSILGKSVTFSQKVEDYWQFGFNKSILTVIVPFLVVLLDDETYESVQSSELLVSEMILGRAVTDVTLTDTCMEIELDMGTRLIIDLRPENFICPEGLVFSESGYPTVVWR
ncbi:hypothetical protein GC163_15900 [bacterium]|nr:hypothetical protein [bacterium]